VRVDAVMSDSVVCSRGWVKEPSAFAETTVPPVETAWDDLIGLKNIICTCSMNLMSNTFFESPSHRV